MPRLTDHELWTLQLLTKELNKKVNDFSTNFDKEENLIGDINKVEELRKDIIDNALTIAANLNYMEYE